MNDKTGSELWKPTLEEDTLADVRADGGHGVKVGQALLVLLADGEQRSHAPDFVVDVISAGFGGSFGGSVKDHGRRGQR